MTNDDKAKKFLTVAEYVVKLNNLLKTLTVRVKGEVTEIEVSAKGHVYFTIKDGEENAVMKCVIWKGVYERLAIKISIGDEVIVGGQSDVYAPWGKLTFKASTVEHAGEGKLKKEYDALLKKLSSEGLMDADKKRPMPLLPTRIGVITSMTGAVIHDFNANLSRRGFIVLGVDSRVEGQQATLPLIKAIDAIKNEKIDVLVVMRGGGSLESMQAFNNETVARLISSFPVPVIAAIGHHKDKPIITMVADAHASTATAAATLLNQSWEEAETTLHMFSKDIPLLLERGINSQKIAIAGISVRVRDALGALTRVIDRRQIAFSRHLTRLAVAIEEKKHGLGGAQEFILEKFRKGIGYRMRHLSYIGAKVVLPGMSVALKDAYMRIGRVEGVINQANPENQLARGYSIVFRDGVVVRSAKSVSSGEAVDIRVADGTIEAEVS